MNLNESTVEVAALEWFEELGYAVGHGPQLAPGEPSAERDSFAEGVLVGRLREAIGRLNPDMREEAREEALRKVLRVRQLRWCSRTEPSIKCCGMAWMWNTRGRFATSRDQWKGLEGVRVIANVTTREYTAGRVSGNRKSHGWIEVFWRSARPERL